MHIFILARTKAPKGPLLLLYLRYCIVTLRAPKMVLVGWLRVKLYGRAPLPGGPYVASSHAMQPAWIFLHLLATRVYCSTVPQWPVVARDAVFSAAPHFSATQQHASSYHSCRLALTVCAPSFVRSTTTDRFTCTRSSHAASFCRTTYLRMQQDCVQPGRGSCSSWDEISAASSPHTHARAQCTFIM